MNIVKKIRGSSSSENNGEDPQNQLGLMHLKKLFNEYSHPKDPLSEQERDNKLYQMLPLFVKIFGSCHSNEMSEKFWDILAFCQQISRLMVSEIRRRASNQSTEAASIAIVKYLEIENYEESSNGWMLLSALNLLAAGDQSIIQTMTSASVPSTLVKCLYLFFDLPEITEEEEKQPHEGCDFTPKERRILLQKIFVQLLVRLCSYQFPCEELARMDDLTLLFSAITSQCPPHNVMWRKSAAEVLTTLSRHGLTDPVVNYIHSKGCVALSIDNMQRSPQLTPLEVVEMFVAVFCFLKDSSEVSQTLLDDFRACQGYSFLSDFLLKLTEEKNRSSETQAAIRNLVLMIASLCMCGYQEIRLNNPTGTLFQMQGFQMPQTTSRGTCVRNVHAFQVLQTVFLKSSSTSLCCTILDAISSVYHSDNANYFILESQNTLSQFTEKIHLKSSKIQEKFFELLEFIVFQLNFVPCKELISLSILLKSNHSISCSILCMKTLLNILKHNAIFKDVYREVGILEVFVTCLNRYYEFLSKNISADATLDKCEILQNDPNESLGKLVLDALTILLSSNNNNSNVFRESGGAKTIHEMVKYKHCRDNVLQIIRELILTSGGDDDMLQILTTMHSASAYNIELKIHILKSILGCLRDSHRTRVIFRKVGGFVYVTSVFVSLDGKLSDSSDIVMIDSTESPESEDRNDGKIVLKDLLQLLNIVFQTLATAMRFEPANAKFFHQEICSSSLCDTLRLLGCFTNTSTFTEGAVPNGSFENIDTYYQSLFTGNLLKPEFSKDFPLSLSFACLIFRFLYDLALDNFDKPNLSGVMNITITNQAKQENINKLQKLDPRIAVSSLNLTQPQPEPLVVHPGIVICMLQLLPSIEHDLESEITRGQCLQLYLAEVVKSLVRSERNQQIMCEAGLAGQLLKIGKTVLSEEKNLLHVPLQYILERLAAQALKPTELREFLRLGYPLQCESLELGVPYHVGGPVPLTRIKTLVSMTTPRDFRAHGSCTLPPFVEMDMSAEGFGCLFLSNIAPQAANITGNIEVTTVGGIGTGERAFPPQTGLSYSTWFCVDKFSDPRTDPHCVRLLTISRIVNNAREDNIVCLSILLSARDKAIIVSTQETLLPPNVGEWEPEGTGDYNARIWCPDLLHEGQWHHLVVVLNRAVLKNSSFSLFLDGQHMNTQKLHYISQVPGGATSNQVNPTSSVYAMIGTPPAFRRYSRLCWKQGVCHLLEDVLSPQTVSVIYQLGPHYVGSLQAPQLGKQTDPLSPLIAEEKVTFGLNAKAMSQLTLARIRKVYSRADNKIIAKQLGMSSNENATPIRILHNSGGHLAGSARSLGAVVVGYLGVRVFSPHPVSTMMETVGGCNVLLGIIAMSQDVESLYAGVKALTCVVKSNKAAQAEMDRKRCYQTLAMFFKKKRNLLNSHILHLTFGLVGTVNSGQESSAIPNITAFQDLLCDLDVWLNAPNGLLRSLLEHLLELVSESSEKRTNVRIMRELQLVPKLLHIISDINENATKEILFALMTILLGGQPKLSDLLHFGQFITSKLPLNGETERTVDLEQYSCNKDNTIMEDQIICGANVKAIVMRNRCLALLHSLLFTTRNTVNPVIGDEISKILGLDWILLFMQPHIHSSSVVWSMRILVVLLANETFITRFREGILNGGYLRNTELISQNKNAVVLGSQLNTGTSSPSPLVSQPGIALPTQIAGEAKISALGINGFQYLEWLLPHHLDVPELYFLLTALIMGQPVKLLASEHTKLDLDRVWAFLWGTPVSHASVGTIGPKIVFCPEAVCVLLTIVRTIVHTENNIEFLKSHPVCLIQIIFSLYHNLPDFMPILMQGDVINSLTAILFPPNQKESVVESEPNSEASTPDETSTTTNPILLGEIQKDSQLTEHPVRKFVIDLLRQILVDSLSLAVTAKSSPVIDLVLDSSPESSDVSLQIAFQTEIITALMDHLLAADIMSECAALPIVPLLQSHIQNIGPNVFYFTARIVDKLWQGYLNKDPHEIFEFIVKLINQSKRRSSSMNLEQLHHSLNRTILYLLSRPTESVAEQMAVLEALHKLTNNRLLIFGAGNHELEFVGCLVYCLLQLTADLKIVLDSSAPKTTWHVNPHNEMVESRDELLNQHQGRNLIVGAAFRVWEELYVCKKPAIEEVFKVTLITPTHNAKAPDLTTTREQVIEAATKLWINYIDSEKKASYRVPWELHNQIQSKIQKVTGGLTRLASRTKVKKDEHIKIKTRISKTDALEYTNIHIGLVKDLWEMRCAQHSHMSQHTQRYVLQDWMQAEFELTRERGLWGPVRGSCLDKWMLDSTEGPHRMRKKTMRNDLFYIQYPYRAELEHPDNRQLKYKVATSFDGKKYFQCYQTTNHQTRVLCEAENPNDRMIDKSSVTSPPQTPTQHQPLALNRAHSEPGEDLDEEVEEDVAVVPDNQTLLRMLEDNEKISHMFKCARIQGLDTTEGLILFGKEHCYVVDGFTLIKNREIRDIDSLLPGAYEPILPSPGSPRRSQSLRQCSKFAYEDIREVHKRRYLLQPIALEVFTGDGRNYLLSFQRKVRNKVYQRVMALATSIADNAQQSVAGQRRTASVEQTSGIFSSLIGETSVTQRWVRGEISNFQYLMHLNTLAGRSYNDLMQYPVFPWILADYESEELDLTNFRTFRDFSKPMGAQSSDRLEQFQKRYKEWDDPQGETPPYHYGTHYSSAMIVCSYLVRLEPFTQHFLRLQGGHFDLADRMFHSIKEAWNSASRHNMADVKELIPEFFYLPEFLTNSNNFDLGAKQNGEVLGHIILPPWAKQDPREFIRVHRQALECDYVSQHLHLWIDLIFGYRQQGQAAVDAVNVFHHLFYEGNVDIYNIDDPLKKNATIGFINNFGQIPKQLFKKPHPCKKMNNSMKHSVIDSSQILSSGTSVPVDKLFFYNLDNLKPSAQPVKELKGPVGQILHPDKTVLAVEQNKVLMPPNFSRYIAWGFADHSLRIGMYDSDRALFVCETTAHSGEILACASPNSRTIITAGTSSVVTVWGFDSRHKSLSVKHSLHGHTDAVTCLAASPAYNIIVSGSRDGTAIVWDMSRYIFVRQLREHVGLVAAVAINDLTGDIATCSATWLHLWSINGDCLATVNTCIGSSDRMQQILCVTFSCTREWDSNNVIITGSTDGVVRMWSMDYVQVPVEKTELAEEAKEEIVAETKEEIKQKKKAELVKQMILSTDGSGIVKSGSESSISEACDSIKESSKRFEEEKEECSDNDDDVIKEENKLKPLDNKINISSAKSMSMLKDEASASIDLVKRRDRRHETKLRSVSHIEHSLDDSAADSEDMPIERMASEKGIRPSKSDTSLTESFVVVDNDGDGIGRKKFTNKQNILRNGFRWQQQLVFRSKLTMHTAYDRKDNSEPASITALAVSKDHRTLYVGDARGRVFSWSVAEQPGRMDHWLKDEITDQCNGCRVKFTLYERKHHCRNCGNLFCSRCSRFESEISRLRILKPVRVCQNCYTQLRGGVSLESQ